MINLKNLIDFLPFEYKDQDTYKVNGKGILERFLEICGEHFEDYITKDIDNILDIIDIDKNSRHVSQLSLAIPRRNALRLWEHNRCPEVVRVL